MSSLDDSVAELLQIKRVAESGNVDDSDWIALQKLLRSRLDRIIDTYQTREEAQDNQQDEPNVEKFDLKSLREDILQMIDFFYEPPFTIQRICELYYCPFKYYDRVSTFLRALEKNLRVISANDWPKSPSRESEGPTSHPECTEALPKLAPSELKRVADDPKWESEQFPCTTESLDRSTTSNSEPELDQNPETSVSEPTEPPELTTEQTTHQDAEPDTNSVAESMTDSINDTHDQSSPKQDKEANQGGEVPIEPAVT